MPTQIEIRSAQLVDAMTKQVEAVKGQNKLFFVKPLSQNRAAQGNDKTVLCAGGNQHTCQPQFFVPALNQQFSLILKGNGDANIVGSDSGARAVIWKNTYLYGTDPVLGNVSVHLEPSVDQAGTLTPIIEGTPFPALNRNTYYFVFTIPALGELISARPAIVEAIIHEIPPNGSYVFRNGPLDFYLRNDPDKKVVAILQAAVTDVEFKRT